MFTGWQSTLVILLLLWAWSEYFSRKMSKLIDEKFANNQGPRIVRSLNQRGKKG